jgi:hypothetical protein
MTTKSPVYWRTKDGRKVVIVYDGHSNGKLTIASKGHICKRLYTKDELTPWIGPETRTVYVHWWTNGEITCGKIMDISLKYCKAIKKITITEGEFDE